MAKINYFYISHCPEIIKKYNNCFKIKKIVNTYSTTTIFKLNYFPRTDKT